MKTTLLIDADIVCFQAASSNQETFDWDDDGDVSIGLDPVSTRNRINKTIAHYLEATNADDYICCLTSKDNWRNDILPSYKMNRTDKPKPLLLGYAREYMQENHPCKLVPRLEADDIMGILSTHPTLIPGKKIIVSEDKDMQTIPGWLWNPRKSEEAIEIHPAAALRYHLYQTLTGDAVDGYSGAPYTGPVKARKIIYDQALPSSELWKAVVKRYEAKGLTEADALVQAQVASICQYQNYDFKNKKVIPWQPIA